MAGMSGSNILCLNIIIINRRNFTLILLISKTAPIMFSMANLSIRSEPEYRQEFSRQSEYISNTSQFMQYNLYKEGTEVSHCVQLGYRRSPVFLRSDHL